MQEKQPTEGVVSYAAALGPSLSRQQIRDRLTTVPKWSPSHRKLPHEWRISATNRLSDFFWPTSKQLQFVTCMQDALVDSYGRSLRSTAVAMNIDPKTLMREAMTQGINVPWHLKPSGRIRCH